MPVAPLRVVCCGLGLLVAALAGCRAPPPVSAQPGRASSACTPPPVAGPLFLRGSMTTWTPREDLAFRYVCNAYLLNVALHGRHEFRVTDARFGGELNFGVAAGERGELRLGETRTLRNAARGGGGNLVFDFDGAYTLRLDFADAAAPRLTIGPPSFDDPDAAPVDDAVARSLRFDSRDHADKTPFGAVTAGGTIAFGLHAARGIDAATLVIERRRLEGPQEVLAYDEVARVPLAREATADGEVWRGAWRFDEIGVYGYYFLVGIGGRRYVYQNNAAPIPWTRELGANGLGAVAPLPTDAARIRRFRQTVYRADFRVPDWARDIVYYYIFPERFRNGDPNNDPRPGPGTFHDRSVEVHAHWLERPWRPHSGDGSDDLAGNDFFGGDLDGISAKLGEIRALGANTLYLTPIFRAVSNHKYDTADYRNVDPHFGGNAAFARLVRAAHARGMRLVLDTSLNHTGSDSIYFDRYAKYPGLGAFKGGHIQPDSPYASWYRFDPTAREPERQYRGWAGAADLPELDKSAPSFRAFAYGAPDAVMKLWLYRGADGWRMDVAPWVPDDFWREWRAAVKGHRPDALAIAEVQFEAAKFFLGDEFDSTMNYVFRNAVQAYAAGADARASYAALELMRETYPPPAFYALMNLLSTHDSPRALYEFGYRDAHADPATIALAKRRLRLAVLFQMIFPGAPTVYYGDEVGMTGGEDPDNRGPYPWPDLGGRPDRALREQFRRLIALRHRHAVLRHGSIDAPLQLDQHLIVLLRRDGATSAITATNNDIAPHEVTLSLPRALADATFVDALGGTRVRARDATVRFTVPAQFGVVLIRR
jgi:glycosidase